MQYLVSVLQSLPSSSIPTVKSPLKNDTCETIPVVLSPSPKSHLIGLEWVDDHIKTMILPMSIINIPHFRSYVCEVDYITYSLLYPGETVYPVNDTYYVLSLTEWNGETPPKVNQRLYYGVLSYLRVYCPITELLLQSQQLEMIMNGSLTDHLPNLIMAIARDVRYQGYRGNQNYLPLVLRPELESHQRGQSTITSTIKIPAHNNTTNMTTSIELVYAQLATYSHPDVRTLDDPRNIRGKSQDEEGDLELKSLLSLIQEYPTLTSSVSDLLCYTLSIAKDIKLRDVLPPNIHSGLYIDTNGRLLHLERLDVNNPNAKVTNDSPYVLPCDCTGYNSEQLDELLDQVITGDYTPNAKSESWLRKLGPRVIMYGSVMGDILSFVTQKNCDNLELWMDIYNPPVWLQLNLNTVKHMNNIMFAIAVLNSNPELMECLWRHGFSQVGLSMKDNISDPSVLRDVMSNAQQRYIPGWIYNKYKLPEHDIPSSFSLWFTAIKNNQTICLHIDVDDLSPDDALETFRIESEKIYTLVKELWPGVTIEMDNNSANGRPSYTISPRSIIDAHLGCRTIDIYMAGRRDAIIGNTGVSGLWRDQEGWHATASCLRAHMTRRWDWRHETIDSDWMSSVLVMHKQGYVPNDVLLNKAMARRIYERRNSNINRSGLEMCLELYNDCDIIYHLLKMSYRESLGNNITTVSHDSCAPWSLKKRGEILQSQFQFQTPRYVRVSYDSDVLADYVVKYGNMVNKADVNDTKNIINMGRSEHLRNVIKVDDYEHTVNGSEYYIFRRMD